MKSKRSPISEPTLKESLQQARQLHSSNEPDQAERRYRNILDSFPDNPEALYGLAILMQCGNRQTEAIPLFRRILTLYPDHLGTQMHLAEALNNTGRIEEAIDIYHHVLSAVPDHAEAHYNLGVLEHSRGNHSLAEAHYRQALTIDDQDVDCHYNLGLLLKEMGRPKDAIASYMNAVGIDPDDSVIHYNLGLALKELHLFKEASLAFNKAVELNDDYGPAYSALGMMYQLLEDKEKALHAYGNAIRLGHNVASCKHMIAALNGEERDTAPREYIRELFDQYADRFDESLVDKLRYDLPNRLVRTLREIRPPDKRFRCGVDLGCGTGLSGEAFRPLTESLHGVDISPKMVDIAQDKNIYNKLAVSDVIDFLHRSQHRYDLFIATDVVIYLGDLHPLFAAVKARAMDEACFVFSTESTDNDGFELQPSGRFAHSPEYVREMAARHDFEIKFHETARVRKEKDTWLTGEMYGLHIKKNNG